MTNRVRNIRNKLTVSDKFNFLLLRRPMAGCCLMMRYAATAHKNTEYLIRKNHLSQFFLPKLKQVKLIAKITIDLIFFFFERSTVV